MKTTQYMSTPPPWYKVDDPSSDTKEKITLVSFWSMHDFHVANHNGFYCFTDPEGCDKAGQVVVHHVVMQKLTHNHYFSTVFFDLGQNIHQQLLDAVKCTILGLNPAYIMSLHCCENPISPN